MTTPEHGLAVAPRGQHARELRTSTRVDRLRHAARALAAAMVALTPAAARAEVELFSVEYQANPGCPGEDTFLHELSARTAQARLSDRDAAKHHIRVEVHQSVGRGVGRLEMQEGDGATMVREVDGRTCREVVSGLALIAALALDPDALMDPVDDTPPERTPPDTTPPPPEPEKPKAPPPPPPPARVPEHRSAPLRGAVGLSGGGTYGLLPVVEAVGSAFVELEKPNTWSTRLAFEYGIPTVVHAGPRSARLDWMAARLEGCPLEIRLASPVWISPCAGIEAGRVAGTGLAGGGVDQPRGGRWPWLAVTAGAQVRLDLQRFVPRIEGGLLAPIYRETFVFEGPAVVLHRVAPVVGFLQLGLAVRIP